MTVTEKKRVTLESPQLKVLFKILAMLAPSYSEIELKEGMICNKSDDKVVTYMIKLPLPEDFELSLLKLSNTLRYLKDFINQSVDIIYLDNMYVLHFKDDDAYFQIRKPDFVVNEFNKPKIDAIEKSTQFTYVIDDANLFNRLRGLSARFKADILVDLPNKKISITDSDKNVSFSKDIDISGKTKFRILQNSLPVLELKDTAKLSYAIKNVQNQNIVIYKLESIIPIETTDVPVTVYGMSNIITKDINPAEV